MRPKNILFKLISGFLLITVLAACAPAAPAPTATAAIPVTAGSPTATVAPTIDITPTIAAVETRAVATAFAGLTQTAQALPTQTSAATNTPPAPTRTLAPLWTLTATLPAFGCTITEVSPSVNSPLQPGSSFDGRWEVRNTGDGPWNTNETDIRYVSGTKLHVGPDVIDLNEDVDEEETIEVVLDMQAPAQVGTYVTNWAIYRGNEVLCGLGLTVSVQQ